MFRAFFDESCLNPKKDKALVFGGFLGKVEEWERASEAWDDCLHQSPSIDYFKYSEARGLEGQFIKFNRTSADAKVIALAKTITNFKLLGVCVSVSFSWFMYRDVKASRGQVGARVYDWGFATATSGMLQYVDREYPTENDKVDFVFDDRGELRACIGLYNFMKVDPFFASIMRRAGECSPGNDKEIAALQMADLLAGELCHLVNTGQQSTHFVLIRDRNKILHIPCNPPRQLPDTLKLQNLARKVLTESGNFLRRSRKSASDRFSDVAEVKNYLNDLFVSEGCFYSELERYLSELKTDPEYQSFRDKFLKSQDAPLDKKEE